MTLGGCSGVARDSDAMRIIMLDTFRWSCLDLHYPERLRPLWWDIAWRVSLSCNLHEGTLVIIIIIIIIIITSYA